MGMTKLLTQHLNRTLTPLGFLKSGMSWRRNHSIAFDVVGIQFARFSSGVTVQLGIYYKNLGNETNPIEEMCHLRARLHGSAEGGDLDGYAEEFEDSVAAAKQFVAALVSTGLPWFDAVKTQSGARTAMGANPEETSSALLDAMKYGSITLTEG